MKIVALGEVMMRLSQSEDELIEETKSLNIYFGGGEYNTLVNLSGLGHQTTIVTALPQNQLSKRIVHEARKYAINTDAIKFQGERLGTYYAILGDEITASSVIYDRSNSAFATSKFTDYDFETIFADADLFHVSGITAALNEQTREMTRKAIKLAKKCGLKISYDSNYRAKLWTQAEAGAFIESILPDIDYAFLGILDVKYLLNQDVDTIKAAYTYLYDKYPNLKVIASTNREVINPKIHRLSVNIFTDKLVQTNAVEINVKDRIGGGDVFTAGVLDGILHQKKAQEIAEFALADTVIKHYRYGDNCLIDRDQVIAVQSGQSLKIDR